jgi:hypothetical protein
MTKSTTPSAASSQGTPRASLAALGTVIHQRNVFAPVREQLTIGQKTVTHAPQDKLYDALIAILAGAHGIVEVNTRLRADVALQRAFGRTACAEQSSIQDTLDACTSENVEQMHQALDQIYREHSRGYRHDYVESWQLLDVDMSGLPCGPKAAFATKGYFARVRNRRGRQLGRVSASLYDEIVTDRVFEGTTQLVTALPLLLSAAQQSLELSIAHRARTIVRIDAGGGSLEDLNWVLRQGYQIHAKDLSSARAGKLAETVVEWVDDPRIEGRQIGWVSADASAYIRPVRRIAVRCRKKNGQWGVGVLISTLDAETILTLANLSPSEWLHPRAELLAYVYFYDQRGGGVESTLKSDKQGLGLTKRNKKRFTAQQIVTLLSTLAHNLIVWARAWLAASEPKVRRYGVVRMVRDLFVIHGRLILNASGQIVQIVLNQAAALAARFVDALALLLSPLHIAVNLGET